MTEIRHIVFDIGKVLIHYDPNLPFSRIIPDADERAEFFATVCTHDWNLERIVADRKSTRLNSSHT